MLQQLQKVDGKLPVIQTEDKFVLNVITPVLHLPSPVSRVIKMKDPSKENVRPDESNLAQKATKAIHLDPCERFKSRPVVRHWQSVDKKTLQDMYLFDALCGGDIKNQKNGDLPVIGARSKSAPVKLLYLDKKGKVDSRGNKRASKHNRTNVRDKNNNRSEKYLDQNQIKCMDDNLTVAKTKRLRWGYCRRRAWHVSDDCSTDDGPPDVYEDISTSIDSGDSDLIKFGLGHLLNVCTPACESSNKNSASTTRSSSMAKQSITPSGVRKGHAKSIVERISPFSDTHKVRTDSRVFKYLKGVYVHDHKKPKVLPSRVESVDHPHCINSDIKPSAEQMGRVFHNAIHFVRMVVRLLASMTDLSRDKTTLSATEDRWHAINTSRQVREMAFNKTAFAKRKGFYKLPRWAIHILDRLPDDRTEAELRRLHALLRGLKSFDKFSEKIQLSMCRSFTYHSVESGRIILRQGHVGINFYFLYTGSVFVNTNDTDVRGNRFTKTEVVLRRGDSFGELALLQDIRRTATISCREDCELLVVDKDTFSRVCPKIFECEKEEKLKFLSRLPLFSLKHWTKDALEKISFDAQIQEYKTNKVVVEDNTKDDWIYFCMNGKCQIIRRLNLEEEIEWRKLQQCALDQMESQRYGTESEGPDGRGSFADITTIHEDDERRSFIVERGESKEELLDSMGLEYRKARKVSVGDLRQLIDLQRSFRLSAKQENQASNRSPTPDQGRTTLTSLMKHEDSLNKEYLYLNIKTIQHGEIFDLSAVLDSQKSEEVDAINGSYLLVSNGARVMRIRRTNFFKHASSTALQHARKLTKRDKIPDDDVLLRCYRDQLNWQVYRQMVLKDAFQELSSKKARSRAQNSHEDRHHQVEINVKINSNNRKTARELEFVLPDKNGVRLEIQQWQQLESLSNKVLQKSNNMRVNFQMSPTKDIEIRVSPEPETTTELLQGYHQSMNNVQERLYLAQRRSSVATGDLRRENLPPCFTRRFSQPSCSFNFSSIQEEEDGSISSHTDY